jgi:hypothetical protein
MLKNVWRLELELGAEIAPDPLLFEGVGRLAAGGRGEPLFAALEGKGRREREERE